MISQYHFGNQVYANIVLRIEHVSLPAQVIPSGCNPMTNNYRITFEINGERWIVGEDVCGECLPDEMDKKYEVMLRRLKVRGENSLLCLVLDRVEFEGIKLGKGSC